MNENNALDPRLAEDLRRLSAAGMEPPRDLWPELERRLRSTSQAPRRRPRWYAAAAAIALVALAAGLLWRLAPGSGPRLLDDLAASRSLEPPPQAGSEVFRARFTTYVAERERRLERISEQLRGYPGDLREEIRDSLLAIEREMREIERSIALERGEASEPELAALYDLELRLLGMVEERLRATAAPGGVS